MPIQGWMEDQFRGTIKPDSTGQYRGTGVYGAFLKNFLDEDALSREQQQSDVKDIIVGSGENYADYDLGPNATITDAKGAVVTQRRERASQEKDDDFKRQEGLVKTGQAPQLASIEAGLEQGRLQHQAQMEGMQNSNNLAIAGLTQSNNQFMAQMADSKDQRAMELQMRREDMDRRDRKDEKSRRRESIQALVAGLSSLGAAFAV